MKNILTLITLLTFLIACKNEKSVIPKTEQNTEVNTTGTLDGGQTTVNIPAGPDGVVHHYICPDKCKGGHSPNPGTCPVCGKTLAHNQAFHDQPGQTPATQTTPSTPTVVQQVPQEQTPEVNIPAGPDGIVHHYICAAGCKGGHSPNAGNCPVCGKALAHNLAFHKQ